MAQELGLSESHSGREQDNDMQPSQMVATTTTGLVCKPKAMVVPWLLQVYRCVEILFILCNKKMKIYHANMQNYIIKVPNA